MLLLLQPATNVNKQNLYLSSNTLRKLIINEITNNKIQKSKSKTYAGRVGQKSDDIGPVLACGRGPDFFDFLHTFSSSKKYEPVRLEDIKK